MSEAWELARQQITRAQKRQKTMYDRHTKKSPFQAGERVFLFKPAERTGARRKFARPFHGPYRLLEVDVNTAKIRPVDRPEDEHILVSLERLRRCPEEVGDSFWPTRNPHPSRKKKQKDCGNMAEVADELQGGPTVTAEVMEPGDHAQTQADSLSPPTLVSQTNPNQTHSSSDGSGSKGGGRNSQGQVSNSPDTLAEEGTAKSEEGPGPRKTEGGVASSPREMQEKSDTICPPTESSESGKWTGRLRRRKSPGTTTS